MSVKEINNLSFIGCTALKEVNVSDGNESFSSVEGVLFNKDKTKIVLYPAAKSETTYTLPESVKIIGPGAFGNCAELKSIIMHKNISFSYGSSNGKPIPTFSANINEIYYYGSQQMWRTISGVENICIAEITKIHFSYGAATKPDSSTYSNSSDSESSSDSEPSDSSTDSVSDSRNDNSTSTSSSSSAPTAGGSSSDNNETSSDNNVDNSPTSSYNSSNSSDSSSTDSKPADSNSSSTSGSDKSPDTGFGGIAMTFGIAALAGAAIVVTKKKQ